MRCSSCGYTATCPCEFDNGLCWTCKFGGKRIDNKVVDNYCEQTLENLENIQSNLLKINRDKVKNYQLSIINSQIKQFYVNPCRFKGIIDNILLN